MKDFTELTNALTAAIADDTILMKNGTYAGDFVSSKKGTPGHPIMVKSAPGEWATIDGSLTINGDYQVWQNLEVKYSGWETRHLQTPPNKNLWVLGNENVCDGLVIHDMTGNYPSGSGLKMNGCLIYHQGWSWTDRGHGHGMYSQNSGPVITFKDCVLFDGFGWGVHVYTEGGTINNYLLDGCTCFRSGSLYPAKYNNILVGGLQVAHNITVKDCKTYDSGGMNIGYNAGADNVTLKDNYCQDGILKVKVTNLTESGNTVGQIGNAVFVRPNEYQNTRAIVTVYNQAEAEEVKVDLTNVTGLVAGDTVKVRNVQDYFVDIKELVLDENKSIMVSMTDHTVATPAKWDAPKTTFPKFGCFVVEKG